MELSKVHNYLTLSELETINPNKAKKMQESLDAKFLSYEIGDTIHFCNELASVLYNPINEKNENFAKGLPCFVQKGTEFIPHFFSFSAFRKTSLEKVIYKGVELVTIQTDFTKNKTERQIAELLAGNCIKVVDTIIIKVPEGFVKDEIKTAEFGELRLKPNGEKKNANAHLFGDLKKSTMDANELKKLAK